MTPDCEMPESLRLPGGCYPIGVFLSNPPCAFPVGTCFGTASVIKDKHGHELDGDWDPEGRDGCSHKDAPEWKAEHAKERKMPKQNTLTEHTSPPEKPQEAAPITAAQEQATEKLKAVTEMPASAAAELSGIVGQDVSGMQVVMAVVAVAGGGAAWKFYNQHSKRKHEENMARIERERGQEDDKHASCKAERATLEAKLLAVESRLAEVEKKAKSGGGLELGGFDPDEFEARCEKLEKQLRKLLKEQKKKATEDEDEDD